MLSFIDVKMSDQRAVEDKVCQLLEEAHRLGYDVSVGSLTVSVDGDVQQYRQIIWYTPRKDEKW